MTRQQSVPADTEALPSARVVLWHATRLELTRLARNWRYGLFAIGFPLAFYVMYTAAQGGTSGPSQSGVPWPTYFMVSMSAFAALGASLSVAPLIAADRAGGWTRQLRALPFPQLAFLAANLATASLTVVPAVVLVMAGAVAVAGVRLEPATWIQLVVVLAIGAIPLAVLGALLGYVVDERSATGAVLALYIGLAILGGLWMPPSLFSGTLLMIAASLPSYHLATLGWNVLSGGGVDPVAVTVLGAYGLVGATLLARRYRSEAALETA